MTTPKVFLAALVAILFAHTASGQNLKQIENLPDSALRVRIAHNTIRYCNEILDHKSQLKDKRKLPGFYANRAASEAVLHQYAKAFSDFSAAISLNPDYVDAYMARAGLYERMRRYQPAVEDLRKVLSFMQTNDNSIIILYNAIAYDETQLHHYDKAIEASTAAIALNPQLPVSYTSRAFIYNLMGKYQLAIDDINLVIFGPKPAGASFPDSKALAAVMNTKTAEQKRSVSDLLRIRADIQRAAKNYRDALNDYSLALNIQPDNKLAYWNRAAAYRANGDFQLSVDDYSKAISLYAGDKTSLSRLYDDRAQMEMGSQQFKQAVADDSLAVAMDPRYAVAYWNMADAYSQSGDYRAGIIHYKKVLSFYKQDKPQLAQVYVAIANNEYFLNDYQQVIDNCNTATAIDPKSWASCFYRARAYLKTNKKELALNEFKKVMALDTTKKSSEYAFALFYTGDTNQAYSVMQNNVIATTNSYLLLSHYYNMACLYSLSNKPDEANTYLKKCIEGGYPKRYAVNDEDLVNIRNTDEYKRLMGDK